MQDETIALSNPGAYGIDSFSGTAPPSASTIFAVGLTGNFEKLGPETLVNAIYAGFMLSEQKLLAF